MKEVTLSLRARLLKVIIIPLIFVVLILTVMRYYEARKTSETIYDNALLSLGHVIIRDVALSEGDLLAETLLETLAEALGDQFFYHVSSESSGIVAGYTNPPPTPGKVTADKNKPLFYDQYYRDEPVRVVVFREFISAQPFEGWVKVTVWQSTLQRGRLKLRLAGRALGVLSLLTICTALIVWLGIKYGLKPLEDLEEAINIRSSDDIRNIQRAVPPEVSSLVKAMNSLFSKLRDSFAAKDAFIANAAHQLRNPIAGLMSQAEAAEKTRDPEELHLRVADVAKAARHAARLTQQLLSMEKVSSSNSSSEFIDFDINKTLENIMVDFAQMAYQKGVSCTLEGTEQANMIYGNEILVREVIENLLDNALNYGSNSGDEIQVVVKQAKNTTTISILDSGTGIPEEFMPVLFDRFTRAEEDSSSGCGLGLAIAKSIVEQHNGTLNIHSGPEGVCAFLTLPSSHMGKAKNLVH